MYVAIEENEPGNLEIWRVSLKQSGNLKSANLEIRKPGIEVCFVS